MRFNYEAAFREGHERNQYVASLITARGIWVECPPLKFASNEAEIVEFTRHEKDLITNAGVIEVKGQGRFFTSDVSAFPYSDQIVDTVESWDGKIKKPIAYVMVCIENGHCVVIPGKTHSDWSVRTIHDKKKDRLIDFYLAKASHLVPFEKLLDFLEKKDREVG
jgi:hypothetical protein